MKKMEFLLFLTLLLLSTPSRSMPEISLRVSNVQISTGDQVVAQIDIEKLESGHAIGAFDISIGYNVARLSLSSIQFGNQLDLLGLGSMRNIYQTSGNIEIIELSLDSSSDLESFQDHQFSLASLFFTRISPDDSDQITLDIIALSDQLGGAVQALVMETRGDTPKAVNEPSLIGMAIPTIAAAMLWDRRRRHPKSLSRKQS